MRIITGIYKGRHFDVPRTFKARPTTDFAKENIFNVLNGYIDLEDADALDLFAGTGSISLELVSRGCRHVTAVEADRAHHAFILRCLKSCKRKYDFIFADPPYALPELPQIPAAVLDGGLLADGGIFVFEHGKENDFSADPRFIERRVYGSVNFSIFGI